MVTSSMNEIEHRNVADGTVGSKGGRSPSTLPTGHGGTAQGTARPDPLTPG